MAELIKKATRDSYGEALVELGQENPNIVVFDADLAGATKTGVFKKAFPDRFFDCGIAEGNMMVKIGATHAGISVGEDGATHQCNEDIALMRTIPGMVVINPADDVEAKAAVKAAAAYVGPVYLRFGRLAAPIFNDATTYKFEMGKGITLRDGKDVTIVATGILVGEAIKAGELLAAEGIDARIINIHTIKPIDKELLVKASRETGRILTCEEHSIIGGLGSAVIEAIAEDAPCKVSRLGVNDQYGHSGPGAKLLEEYGFTAENIAARAKELLK